MNIDKEKLEAQKELISHAYGQARAYTNLILVAGYAGFFAIWSFLKPELTKPEIFWSAILVSVSLAAFVFWEVYQGYFQSRQLLGLVKAVKNPDQFAALIEAHKLAARDQYIVYARVWSVVFFFSVVSGLAGVLVLLFAFVRSLWSFYTT
ncbi:hypothetical protein [Polaromonas sp.]|uniref:hypothetical protein n=1 Tax=Polaromonas sp. TaxID=1869339 RepID=UPI002486DEF1|nr:hypothetical protein [Polaromonas sp.]MDI1273750.1 hypothetical protein [Polaromonas sp.]